MSGKHCFTFTRQVPSMERFLEATFSFLPCCWHWEESCMCNVSLICFNFFFCNNDLFSTCLQLCSCPSRRKLERLPSECTAPLISSCLQKPRTRLNITISRWDQHRSACMRLPFSRAHSLTPALRRASVRCPSAWPRPTCPCPTCPTRKERRAASSCPSETSAPASVPASSTRWLGRYVLRKMRFGFSSYQMICVRTTWLPEVTRIGLKRWKCTARLSFFFFYFNFRRKQSALMHGQEYKWNKKIRTYKTDLTERS